MRDIASNVGVSQSIIPQVLTATATGTTVDTLGFGSAGILIQTGALVGAALFAPKVQESDDNSAWTDVVAADLIGTLPAALVASATIKVSYRGSKRYIRPVLTYTSGTSLAANVVVIKGHAASRPVA